MIRSVSSTILGSAVAMSIALAQPPPKIIILVGPPGSGKTTQANLLAKKHGIPAFSMADLLKKEMAKKDPVTKALAATIASGEMLPDETATNLIRLHLLRSDFRKGFVLDGFPATAGQAKALDRMLEDVQLQKPVVVVLEASDDIIRKRMLGRRRVDDKPENIDRRIREFRDEAALLAGWAGHTRVVLVNSNASIAQVSAQIEAGLEKAWLKQLSQRP